MRASRPVVVVFKDVARDRFRKWRARIRVDAVETVMLGDTGSARDGDSKVIWAYAEETETLIVTCTERPWWLIESAVRSRINAVMEAACA